MNIRSIYASLLLLACCSTVLFSCHKENSQALTSAFSSSAHNLATDESKSEESLTVVSTVSDIPFVPRKADSEPFSHDESRFGERYDMRSFVITSTTELNQLSIKPFIQYTDQFFDEHVLLFFTKIFGDKRKEQPIIRSLTYSQNTLFINADRMKYEIILPAEEWWCGFLEISKTDIQGVDLSSVNLEINVDDIIAQN